MNKKIKSLKSNQEFMKYFSNTAYLFIDKIFKMGIGFFVIIYLTRYLGPEQFGVFSYVQSFVSIFVALATLGIGQNVTRDIVSDKAKTNSYLGTSFLLIIAASLVSMLLLFILNYVIYDKSSKDLINILMITILFQAFYIVIDSYFQANVLSKYIVYASNTGFIISALIKFLLIYFEFPLVYFVYALVFDGFFLLFAYLYVYRYIGKSIFDWKFEKKMAIKYIRVAIPLLTVSVSAFIYTRIDQIMIKHMLGDEAVGYYAAAVRVSELFYFIPGIIVASIFPKLIEAKKHSEEKYLMLFEKLYRLTVWIAVFIALFIFFGSEIIVNLLYGEQFKESSKILNILSWSIVFASISSVFVKILYIEHWEKKYMYISLLGVFTNSILNYIFIVLYGAQGAAVATLLTLILLNYLYDIFDKDLYKLYYLKLKCFIPIQTQIKEKNESQD